MTFQNKKILVAGLGGTGISMIAYLRKNGAEVAAYDAELKAERVSQIGKMFDGLVFYTGRLKDALDNGFDILALSPGISERQPDIEAFKQNGGCVLGDIELLADVVNRRGDKDFFILKSHFGFVLSFFRQRFISFSVLPDDSRYRHFYPH